jgi:serine/threonine-protein kinase
VADALEYAHQKGIVHRDIKPENILLHGGHAMVADFGIALAASRSDGGTRMTETGMSLGTPHYMSPEQSMGEREITPKADIYALGCVLYEMLTAEPPFTGATAQAIIARVMTEEPRSLTLQRRTIPPNVEAAVRTALEKLPADRFASAAAFAEALGKADFTLANTRAAGTPTRPHAGTSARLRSAAQWVALAAVAVAGAWGWLRSGPPQPVSRYSIALGAAQAIQPGQGPRIAISPDGSRFVYVGPGDRGGRLWLRERDKLLATPLPGTDGAISPFFSPDGQRVGFYTIAPMHLRVVSLGGEPPVTVADSAVDWDGGAWGTDDFLYSDADNGLVRVRPGGGAIEQVTRYDSAHGEIAHNYPDVLPNAKGVVFTVWHRGATPEAHDIAVVNLRTGVHRVLVRGVYARYVRSGHLVYVTSDGMLLAAPFDQDRMELTGPATALTEGVNVRGAGFVDLTVSSAGTLLFLSGGATASMSDLVWVRRDGTAEVIDSGAFATVALSPDGRRLAVSIVDGTGEQIWVRPLPVGPLSKLTFEATLNFRPAWMPDGQSVSFVSSRGENRDVFAQRADGSSPARLVLDQPDDINEVEWSRDGRWLVFRRGSTPVTDILAFRPGVDSAPTAVVASAFSERNPALSPDGRWLAYVSDESGQLEVYVRPFPDAARAKWQVSLAGGSEPLWSRSGRELFYRSASGEFVAAEIVAGPTLTVGRQRSLFQASGYASSESHRLYDVAPDDRRFLMVRERGGGERADLILVQNWFEELRAKVGRRHD